MKMLKETEIRKLFTKDALSWVIPNKLIKRTDLSLDKLLRDLEARENAEKESRI